MNSCRHSRWGVLLWFIIMIGAALLNFTEPPWQTIGVIIFLGCLFYPLLLPWVPRIWPTGHRVWTRKTEGTGYVSGDYECWCIHPVPFEEWCKQRHERRENDAVEDLEDSVYPSDLFPQGREWGYNPKGVDYEKKVRYRVLVEIEEIAEE